MDWFAYGMPLLLFQQSPTVFSVSKAAGSWKDFTVKCAPNTGWLSIDAVGTLSGGPSAAWKGGVTDGTMPGQKGGVCVVAALHQATATSKWERRETKVVAIWPQLWTSLNYGTNSVSTTLGDQLPTLKLIPPQSDGLLKPSDFFVACGATPSTLQWSFDSLLGSGLLEGRA